MVPSFGRHPQFDERSRNFSVVGEADERPLRSYTWRCNEWFDQGREGACVAYALGHELAARAAEVKGITDRFLIERIYWEAQRIDPWDGGAYPGAPFFYEGTSILAGVKAAHRLGLFETYSWGFGLRDVLLGVGYHGPCVIGVPWTEGMADPDEKGFIHPTGSILGGHAVLVNSVNVPEERVTIRNSWGRGWGRDGNCYLRFDDLGTLLNQMGEAVFLQKRRNADVSSL